MTELRGLLERRVRMLDASGVPFMIAGSFASMAHGLPRTTQDIDIVIDPPTFQTLDTLIASVAPDNYYVDADTARDALRRRSMFNVIDQASGWKIDFIVRKNRDFPPARSRETFSAIETGTCDSTSSPSSPSIEATWRVWLARWEKPGRRSNDGASASESTPEGTGV